MAAEAVDPWAVQPRERARYEEQFKSLNPINGIVTGMQAKGFFCLSKLSVDDLSQIWALADVDSDGKLDINEFSIACKLINLKLRNFPLPSTLPPVLKALVLQSPVISSQMPAVPPVPMQLPVRPAIPPQPIQPIIPAQPIIPIQPMIPIQPPIPPQPVLFQQQQYMGAQPILPSVPIQPMVPVQPQPGIFGAQPVVPPLSRPSLTGLASIPSGLVQQQPAVLGAPPTLPQPIISAIPAVPSQVTPVEARSIERRASVESQSSAITSPTSDWGVPHQTKLKYTQLFNTTDRTRTGFLSSVQARNILLMTKLPQNILAQVWGLADTDKDGRLSCEEFVLAMHLCDMAKEGQPVPATLPYDLVPPTMRRRRGSSFSQDDKTDPNFGFINNVTFEDKRKENFDKGQAELDRRRATLMEQQRKEKEERERKEREEEERREQLRLEQEARRQAELQDQLQKQREMEQLQEEQRRRALEQREAARKEAERQRQQEWEDARTLELESQRMKEQEAVLRLKAKNQTLAIELSSLSGKVKDLSSKITETRAGVASVKSTIDGMRTTRDTHMTEMAAMKTKLKEQNQRLLLLTQEKAKLDAKNKVTSAADAAANEQTRQAFTNKQITIKNLTDKLSDLQNEVASKTEVVENNNQQLKDMRGELNNLINSCESLYETYADKRDAVLQLKAAKGGWNAAPTASWETPAVVDSWGAAPADAWGPETQTSQWPTQQPQDTWSADAVTSSSDTHRKYRALYEFSSRNPDELSFMPGDTILVSTAQQAEPGWLMGELQGRSGWFPESYVEPLDGSVVTAEATSTVAPEKTPLEGIIEVPEGDGKGLEGVSKSYISVYPYESAEVGDLSFQQGERIIVIKKDGDWWTGVIGDRTGIFPSNYVQPDTQSEEVAFAEPAAPITPPAPVGAQPEPVSVPAEAAADSDDVFLQPSEMKVEAKSPVFPNSSNVSGRETPASPATDMERIKPATPDFSSITAAQTKIGKKGEIATVIAPYQATSTDQLSLSRGQLVCIRKKTTTGWWEGELQAKGKKKQVGWFPASYVKVMASRRLSQTTPDFEAEMNAQKVIAMFAYKALNQDELSFEKDDVIIVLSRDDPAWWKGDLKGAVGLFPSNYVMPVDSQSVSIKERLRQEAIHELVESERAYTNDMATVRTVFEKPLSRSGLVTREQLGRIFLNWRDILKGNHYLLKLLDERKISGSYSVVGDILCDILPRMSAYVRFCSCQLSAGALLQELTDSSTAFRELCRQCQRDSRTQGLPLSAFLIKPMQRITKYSLLIAKIIEHTPEEHPDRFLLEEALKCADKLCSQVNEGVREQENAERLEWLQSHIMLDGLEEPLVFNSLTKKLGPRKFIYHGALTKTRSNRELFGFLLSDCLVLAQPLKPHTNGHLTLDKNTTLLFRLYKKPLLNHDISIEKVNDKSFVLSFNKGQCALTAASVNEANNWVKNITNAQKMAVDENSKCDNDDSGTEKGPAIGRLLVEIVEAVDLEVRNIFCEMRLGSQKQNTPITTHPFKISHSMQFIVRNVNKEIVQHSAFVHNEFLPNDVLDRSEVRLTELLQHSRSGGPVLRKFSLRKNGKAQVHIKFDLVLFSPHN